jgi:uncharacterized sulfatase
MPGLRFSSAIAASLAAICLMLTSVASAADRPNVVLILSDDQAWTDYGFLGHEQIQTPALDKLAKQSLTFTRGYVPISLCRPSLMTLITGKYPHQHGITGNDPPQGTPRQAMLKHVRREPNFVRLLAEHGYRTFQAGKWWEGNPAEGGFTQGMTHGDPKRGGRHGDVGLKIGREGLQPVFDFIAESKDQPFFVWYAPMLPHQPHNPPQRLLDKYKDKVDSIHVAKYYAMCEWWDETCGELLNYLDEQKLSDNTLVIYAADNGWIQDPTSPKFTPRSKRSPYEGGIRTPIMFRWPGHVKPHLNTTTPVSSISFAATILEACHIEPAKGMAPAIAIETPEKIPTETLYGEIFEHDVADIDAPAKSLLYRWVIDGDWKLILPVDGQHPELFAIKTDPSETKNVAAAHPEVVAALTKKLDDWWKP